MLASFSRLLACGVLCLSGALATPAAIAQVADEFNLPQQSLADSLRAIGRQTAMNILFEPESVEDKTAPAVRGHFSAREAISHVLAGTRLTAQQTAANTMLVRPVSRESTYSSNAVLPLSAQEMGAPEPTKESRGWYRRLRLAQTDAGQSERNDAAEPAESGIALEEIVVTGTHIRGVHPSSSPLSVYTREDIERTGATTTEQFLRTLPQNLSSMDPTANAVPQQDGIQAQGNAFQGGGVNLHGLGFNTTLVLLNGHRVAPAGSNGSFSDVTLIPVSAIERIEVLSSGASAIYGTDAVAGVVNIILRNTFEGAEISARYGDSTQGGGEEYGGSVALGHSWDGGNVVGVVDYLDQSGLQSTERNFVNPSAGVIAIMPSSKRKSAFVTVRQRVAPRVQLSSDLLYSNREYINDSILFGGFFVSHVEGDVEQRGFAPSALIDLNDNWRLNVAGNHSRLDQETHVQQTFFGTPFPRSFRTRKTQISSLDIVADGSLLTLPGGKMSVAVGVAGKTEKTQDVSPNLDTDIERDNFGVFGELRLPIIGQNNAQAFAKSLELSVAGRYDNYNGTGGGSKTTPHVGLSWSPARGANIRGTYGQSFRAPGLEQLNGEPLYFNFSIPNPANPGTDTIFDATPFNPDLQPEESTAYSLGFDLDHDLVPNTSFSATYFRIKFKERIGQPILQGGIFNVYNELDRIAPFLNSNPSQEEIDFYVNSPFFEDISAPGPAPIGAIFDSRPLNLAESTSEGIDFSARYDVTTRGGNTGFFVGGTRLFTLEHRLLPATPPEDRLGTLWNPPDWKLRGGVDWALGNFAASIAVNYISEFDNPTVTPAQRIASWTTGDLQLSYRFANLFASLNVINVTDEAPPFAATPPIFADVGYDPANASPLGRFISLRLTSQW